MPRTEAKQKTETDAPVAATPEPATVVAYKGFDANFQCRGYQFEVGETYEHDGNVVACESGFHACEHPLNVFRYYSPAKSRYAEVALAGAMSRHGSDTKIAAAKITVNVELSIGELTRRAIDWVFSRAKLSDGPVATEANAGVAASGDQGAATASGDQGAATASGRWGAATASGDQGAATASGDRGAATASGDQGAATASGDRGAATASGDQGAAMASGYQGAATASGDQGAATASGDRGAATASGYRGAATASGDRGAATASGDQGAATASGDQGAATASGRWGAATASNSTSVAHASGFFGKVRGVEGAALHLDRRNDDGMITHTFAGIVGRDNLKPMTWYALDENGRPVECE